VRAAELILSRLDGDRTRARTVTLDTRLIVRGSGELRPDTPAPAILSNA